MIDCSTWIYNTHIHGFADKDVMGGQEVFNLLIMAKGAKRIVAITDAIRPVGLPNGESTSGWLAVTKKRNINYS